MCLVWSFRVVRSEAARPLRARRFLVFPARAPARPVFRVGSLALYRCPRAARGRRVGSFSTQPHCDHTTPDPTIRNGQNVVRSLATGSKRPSRRDNGGLPAFLASCVCVRRRRRCAMTRLKPAAPLRNARATWPAGPAMSCRHPNDDDHCAVARHAEHVGGGAGGERTLAVWYTKGVE